jgi:hypothetical protein
METIRGGLSKKRRKVVYTKKGRRKVEKEEKKKGRNQAGATVADSERNPWRRVGFLRI